MSIYATLPTGTDICDRHPECPQCMKELRHFHKGGVCCISCFTYCSGCDLPYINEYLTFEENGQIDPDDGLPMDAYWCHCCAAKRAEVG